MTNVKYVYQTKTAVTAGHCYRYILVLHIQCCQKEISDTIPGGSLKTKAVVDIWESLCDLKLRFFVVCLI